MTQLEYLEKAVQLKRENPGADIHICVASEEMQLDFGWTAHEISRVELGYWYCPGTEQIYTDVDEVIEKLSDEQEREVTEEEAYNLMSPAILIYTRAG